MTDTHDTDLPETPQKKPATLTDDLSGLVKRLDVAHGRIVKLGAALYGAAAESQPSPATAEVQSVRSIIDAAFRTLAEIEGELSRVEARL